MKIKQIALLILLVVILVFILQNTQVVEVQIFFWKVSMSRSLILIGTFFLGLVGGWGLYSFRTSKK